MTIKEFGEWFFRNYHKTSGFKQDQEVGFPLKIQVGDCSVGQRFLDGDYPTEDVLRKFVASVLKHMDWEDRAKDSDHPGYTQNGYVLGGHVTIATDDQARGAVDNFNAPVTPITGIGVNGDENKYSRTVRPSQLPTVDDGLNMNDMVFNFDAITATMPANGIHVYIDPTVTTRTEWVVQLSDQFMYWFKTSYDIIKAYIDSIEVTGSAVTYTGTNLISITKTPATGTTGEQFQVKADLKFSDAVSFSSVSLGSSPTTMATTAITIPGLVTGKRYKFTGIMDFGTHAGPGTPSTTTDTTGTYLQNVLTFRFLDVITSTTLWSNAVEYKYSEPSPSIPNRHINVTAIVGSMVGFNPQVALQVTNHYTEYGYILNAPTITFIVEEL